jgi:ABC-type proline/glycine betaine transport system ATPase subunit
VAPLLDLVALPQEWPRTPAALGGQRQVGVARAGHNSALMLMDEPFRT